MATIGTDDARPGLSHRRPRPRRLFFALWPVPSLAADLHALSRRLVPECGGRPVPAENLHLTLAFLGDVAIDRIPGVLAVGAGLRRPVVEFVIDRVNWWPKSGIVWAGCAEVPALRELAGELRERLVAVADVRVSGRFAPHVTLLRHAERAPPARVIRRGGWKASELVLAASTLHSSGSSYEQVAAWPLQAVAHEAGAGA